MESKVLNNFSLSAADNTSLFIIFGFIFGSIMVLNT
jgi:hypothetical protein